MGEPYDARDCPLCGSDRMQSYSASTMRQLGYGSVCLDCGLTWDLASTGEEPGGMPIPRYPAATESSPAAERPQRRRS